MSDFNIGDRVTAQNPGGRRVTGRLVGHAEPGFVRIEWFGPWFYEGARRYVGTYPAASLQAAQDTP